MISGVDETTGQPLALTRVPKKVLEREDFILLFVTQLRYQDPMKPVENNEMAMQMALFSQVDQLFKLNEGFEKLLEMARGYDISLTASLVGKLGKAQGTYGRVENGRFLGAEFELEGPANRVEVVIYNESGEEVRRLDLGALSEGTHTIEWDATDESGNTVPDGNYRLRVLAHGAETDQEVSLRVYGRITGAVLGDEPQIILNAHERLHISDIEEILDPETLP